WSGQEDVVVGSPIANRNRRETEGLIGFFVNTLALRTDVSGDPTFRELLGRVRETTLGAYQHQDVPFERLVEELDVERSLSHTPLFQVIFLVEEDSGGPQPFRGIEAEPYFADHEVVKFDLGISVVGGADGLGLGIAYRAELWDAPTMERLLESLALLLAAVAADPGRRVLELPLMADEERERLVAEWSGGRGQAPSDRPVHEIFAEQAARTPDAVALTYGSESVTYAELDARSDALARRLAALGVGSETRVGICVERSPEMVVGLLGILKAGGAYVPLDPAYPAERLAFMLADADARIVLTQERLRGRLPELSVELVVLDGELPEHDDAPLPADVSPESLAYVIYTSGSTGQPKGTEVPHRAIPGFFRGVEYVRFDEDTVTLQHSSTSWDALTLELWPALLSGGRCVLLPAQSSEPALLGEQVRAHGADTLWLTAAYFNLIVDTTPEILPGVAQVMIGGEAVSAPHVRRALELHPGLRLVNGYGPSECTVFTSCYAVPRDFDAPVVPIGRPVGDRRVYLLDRGLTPVPVGVPGELFVGGPAVARGYLGRAELTAERFVPDPFGEPGARLYRSGDRVKWRADGLLEFVGRTDFQAKIRGFRVEPGEVAGMLAAHPQLREAAVVARDGSLVAYVVGTATAGELREHLRASLPEYMVPTLFVMLDALPLTPNGKVDRRALPAPESFAADGEYVAPRTPTEEVLAGIWAEVLGAGRVGVHAHFFDLGGHSLLATRVVSKVRGAFGVELPLRALFEEPTVTGLAGRVDALLRAGDGTQAPPVVPVPRDRPLPLSFAQQRLWFVEQVEPGTSAYNIPVPMRLRGPLDAAVLGRALDEVVRRHEALRTVFAGAGGEPAQVVRPASRGVLAEVELGALPAEAAARELQRLTDAESLRPFDLERGPLFRAVLVRVAPDDAALLLSMHHIVSDGWSMGVLTRELSVLYGAFSRGEPSPLAELPFQYADFAAWQRGWLSGGTLERQLAWWKAQLAGAPPLLELPTDRPRTAVRNARGGVQLFSLPADTSRALRELSRREGATLFMTLLAAWQLLLARHAGQEDVVVGSPIAGRTHLELEGMIGFFVNTLALRTDLSGDPTFPELLGRVRETTLGAYQHQDVPFERLVEELEVPRSLTHSPLFQAVLSLQNVERMEERLGEARVEPLGRGRLAVRFDLTLALMEEGEEIHGALTYRAELWDGETTGRMLDHLRHLLAGIAADPDRRLSALPLLAPADRERVLHAPNATAAPFSVGACLHELIEAQARRAPDAPAVACGGRTLTYAELDRRAAALARGLRARGVGPEARVALLLEPGLETVVALLGVLKAGGAYVPLDTGSPAERLAWTLADSGARLVLTQPELAERVPGGGAEVVVLDGEREGAYGEAAVAGYPLSPVPCPLNLAYVIYTSGSTGRPKGVLVPHRGVVNSTEAYARVYGIGPGSRVLLFAPLHFDASVLDVFTALCSGATLVLASREALMPGEGLTGLLRRERVTHLKITPSALAVTPPAELPDLEAVMVGGEACGAELVASWAPGRRFFNGYGATEHSVRCTAQLCTDATRPPPVGRPIANARLYVLDAGLEPVPTGVAGEVYMAGVGVTRGYLHRAELTAERFVPDPYSGEPGARMYRSGDRGRWLAEGTLDFVGRVDFQLKVRGYRIEPGEVEAALLDHAAVADAVVVARGDRAEERYLAAYAVPREGIAAPDAAALRAHLHSRLPEHLVPSAIVLLDRLPLTSNGKIDRRALPAPEPASGEGYAAPRTPTEEVLAGIWAQVLGVERVGRDAGFFALGGHSLLATRVVSRLREAFRVEVPLRALFEAPTVAGLAGRIDALLREGAGTDAPPLARAARKSAAGLPLSFAQQRLWFLDRLEPGSTAYNVPRALRLRGPLDAGVLGRVLAEIVRRHEALRTVFGEVDGGPVQTVHAAGAAPLAVVDLVGLPEDAREAQARRWVEEEARRPFDLERGPLLRTGLLRLGAEEHVLVLSMHHIVSDGWSTGVLFGELAALYEAYSRGEASPLPELEVQYADFAAWQRGWLAGEVLERQLAWWRERLAGAPAVLEIPTDHPRRAVPGDRGAGVFRTLAPEHAERLRALARSEGATLYMVLLAVLDVLLARWSGQEDVVVGSPIANRNRRETEGLIGFFVNTLALRTDVSGDPTFRELLGRVRETTLGAYQHQDVPFERLVEELDVERSLSHTPLFQVMFSAEDAPTDARPFRGIEAEPYFADHAAMKFDLGISAVGREEGLALGISYRAELWDAPTMERLLDAFALLLESVAADPGQRVLELPLKAG
ncbi:MAG TPA: amino acid adenylation domain-containing protein, partial [Longimicrobiaceae bacterium]